MDQGKADSVSGFIANSLAQQRRREALRELVAETSEEAGEPDVEATAWADEAVALAKRVARERASGNASGAP